jgi:hypothetical protein
MYMKRKLSQRIMRERINSRFNNKLEENSEDKSFEKFKEKYHARRFKEAQLKRVNEAWDDDMDDEIERSRRNYNFSRLNDEGRYFSSYDPEDDGWEEEEEDEYFIPSEEDFAQILRKGDPEAVPEAARILHDWYTRQDYQDDYYNADDFLKHGLHDIEGWVEEGDFTADHTPIIERALGITKKEESKKNSVNEKLQEARDNYGPRAHFYKNGKEISRKRAAAWLGAERLKKREDDAFEDWKDDPLTILDWADGFEIKFKY